MKFAPNLWSNMRAGDYGDILDSSAHVGKTSCFSVNSRSKYPATKALYLVKRQNDSGLKSDGDMP